MAAGWVKSLHCKSTAIDDVVAAYHPKPKKPSLLPTYSSCTSSSQALRDVVFLLPRRSSSADIPPTSPPDTPKPKPKRPPIPKSRPKPKPKKPVISPSGELTELPAGHSSRRVVEIIFGSSWSGRGDPFPGQIEMLFRIHNPARTVARFEDYRSAVRARSGGDARCAVDGNEMMRFHSAPPSSAPAGPSAAAGEAVYDARVVRCQAGIRTFAGSGGAHDSAGLGPGRRAMLVCRVIAGRVRGESEPESAGESVALGKGELIVFDPRAVLPCFLIIYKV